MGTMKQDPNLPDALQTQPPADPPKKWNLQILPGFPLRRSGDGLGLPFFGSFMGSGKE